MLDSLPRLVLLPNLLDEEATSYDDVFPKSVEKWVGKISGLIAESEKGGRYFLRRFTYAEGKTFRDIPIKLLNEHTKDSDLSSLLEPMLQGQTWGLISDAGLPCLADPGAKLVALARKKKIAVEACVGPSSLFLALMLSGLSAQKFFFHGYLPKEVEARQRQLKEMQKLSQKEGCTQLFIEAPYRSQSLFEELLQHLEDKVFLSIAVDLTMPSQLVMTMTVKEWKSSSLPNIQKKPVVFLFGY